MAFTISAARLARMSDDDKTVTWRKMVEASRQPVNGELRALAAKIRRLEQRYEVTSEKMREQVASGERRETWEVCQWLMLLSDRDRLAERRQRSE